jgi:hypothetical protein
MGNARQVPSLRISNHFCQPVWDGEGETTMKTLSSFVILVVMAFSAKAFAVTCDEAKEAVKFGGMTQQEADAICNPKPVHTGGGQQGSRVDMSNFVTKAEFEEHVKANDALKAKVDSFHPDPNGTPSREELIKAREEMNKDMSGWFWLLLAVLLGVLIAGGAMAGISWWLYKLQKDVRKDVGFVVQALLNKGTLSADELKAAAHEDQGPQPPSS